MDYNYHSHTVRCNHATGSEEEYINAAIVAGIKYMGFSDHAPFKFPDGYESFHRIPMAFGQDYISDLRDLREKYKDKIELKIGFEMEYYPSYFETMLKIVIDLGGEYLILGQHFLNEEHPDGIASSGATTEECLKNYVNYVVDGIKTGYFTYVAHPDIIAFEGEEEVYQREMRKICVASKEYNVPLEINFTGIRKNRHYPNNSFWKIVGEIGAPVTFGMDAHITAHAGDIESAKVAEELVKKFSLNYIGKPTVIDIQKKYKGE